MLSAVDGISHEAFLHGDLVEQQYLNANSTVNPYSHSAVSVSASSYLNGYDINVFNTTAIRILNSVQRMPIFLNIGQKTYSPMQLWNKFILPGLW